jgi:hypothetical protein
MRRLALLLAAPALAAGLLAGCDLPAGSPKVLGPDQVPNDTAEEAPTVRAPLFVNGSLDPNDTGDFYAIDIPPVQASLEITCTTSGDLSFGQGLRSEQSAEDIYDCDGQPHVTAPFLPADGGRAQIVIAVLGGSSGFTPYTLVARFVPPTTVIGLP